jgi:hypothetical protein
MTDSQNIVGAIAPPTSIVFFGTFPMSNTKVMEITKDGISVNPDVSVDDAAKAVLNALEGYIKNLVERARYEEREACAKREWVGLHEHELQVLEYNDPSGERLKLAKAVEAKLKEKNT